MSPKATKTAKEPPKRKAKTAAKEQIYTREEERQRCKRSEAQLRGNAKRCDRQQTLTMMVLSVAIWGFSAFFSLQTVCEVLYTFVRVQLTDPGEEMDNAQKEVLSWMFSTNGNDWTTLEAGFLVQFPQYRPGSGGGDKPSFLETISALTMAQKDAPYFGFYDMLDLEADLTKLEERIIVLYATKNNGAELSRKKARALILGMILQRGAVEAGGQGVVGQFEGTVAETVPVPAAATATL